MNFSKIIGILSGFKSRSKIKKMAAAKKVTFLLKMANFKNLKKMRPPLKQKFKNLTLKIQSGWRQVRKHRKGNLLLKKKNKIRKKMKVFWRAKTKFLWLKMDLIKLRIWPTKREQKLKKLTKLYSHYSKSKKEKNFSGTLSPEEKLFKKKELSETSNPCPEKLLLSNTLSEDLQITPWPELSRPKFIRLSIKNKKISKISSLWILL